MGLSAPEYYSSILRLSVAEAEAITQPAIIHDAEQHGSVGIRHLLDVDSPLNRELNALTYYPTIIGQRILDLIAGEDVGRSNVVPPTIPWKEVEPKLIDKKIVTGQLLSLNVVAVSPDELPAQTVEALKKVDDRRPRSTLAEVGGYDSFFRVWGELQLGRLISPVACVVGLTPIIDTGLQPFTSRAREHARHTFRRQIRQYPLADLHSGLRDWNRSAGKAFFLEARAKARPLRMGGKQNHPTK